MNEVSGSGSTAEEQRKQLVELFLQRTLEDVEHMRRSVPQLIAADQAAWQELRFAARRAGGMAKTLELGLLAACAKELVALADEKFAGKPLDAPFLLAVTSAIEVVGIELERLAKESP
ncbi:MAG: hypothetical protein WDO72_08760 [Pseudomonadota bacterium]